MDALPLIALAVWSFAIALAGGVAGLVLGNLRLPLVVLLASSPAAAAGANVAISGAAAAAAAVAHIRAGRVNARLFWLVAPPSMLGGVIGGVVSGWLPARLLLGVIALVVLYGAVEISRLRRNPSPRGDRGELRTGPGLATGFGVGLLGGLVGLILGSLRLPAMLRWVGADARSAVATNSAIGVTLAFGAVLGHLGSGVDWNLVAVGAGAAIPGALLGARLVGRLPERTLLGVVALLLVLSAAAMLAAAFAY